MKTITLTAAEKSFFALVARAAFANPFSAARAAADLAIAPMTPAGQQAGRTREVIARTARALAALDARGGATLDAIPAAHRDMLRTVFLFDAYHRVCDEFDQLIVTQLAAGHDSCPVPFARASLDLLMRRGFSPDEALRYFAMFFQLRRAFYFINDNLTGAAPCMCALRERLWNATFTHDIRWYDRCLWNRMEDFSTLLLGETGTGKGTAAAAIGRSGFIPFHQPSARFAESFTASFVAINLSQFPESLIESELFGHCKGAFTGAIAAHDGIFARCSRHGAIFLDEIGDVSIPVQIKLLHVLQERVFSPVGSHLSLRFEGRVIAATNHPLDELRRAQRFRDDFYYRLCSDVITVPPLRQRIAEHPAELDLLLERVLRRMTGADTPALRAAVRQRIAERPGLAYAWPGNVRELEQCVRRIIIAREYPGDAAALAAPSSSLADVLAHGQLDARALLARYAALLYQRTNSYLETARIMKLDRRTVKALVSAHARTNA